MTLAQFVDIISYLIQLIPIGYFMGIFIQAKHRYRFMAVFASVIVVINLALFFNSTIQRITYWIAYFLVPLIAARIPKLKTFLYTIIAALIMNIFSLPHNFIMLWLYPGIQLSTDIPIYANVGLRLATCPLVILSWYISNKLCSKMFKFKSDDSLKRYIPFIIVEAVVVILMQVNMLWQNKSMQMLLIANICVFFAMIIIDLLLVRTINQLNQSHKTELELQQAQSVIRSQSENYAMFQSQMLSLHKIRHDVSNQLSTISYLMKSGNYDEAEQQLNAFQQVSSQLASCRYTGNTTIDAVINIKLADLGNNNIQFDSEGTLPVELPIDPSALCSIASNMLDNAIRTCRKLDTADNPAVISFNAGIRQNYLILRCTNPCTADTQVPDTSLPGPKDLHGWGIHILRQIAEQYSGSADFNIRENKFIAEIQLCLDKAKNNSAADQPE